MSAEPEVVDDKEQSRYEVHLDGETVAITDYVRQPGLISFTHTETAVAHEGEGLASRMVEQALRDARAENLAVVPFCPFVRRYIRKHEEFRDLVPEDRREEFGLD
jgi:predicted GNAT family acetyltransferase